MNVKTLRIILPLVPMILLVAMVAAAFAAHGWDVAGAKEAGMQTAFIARPGKALYPLAKQPDYIVKNLEELASLLTEK